MRLGPKRLNTQEAWVASWRKITASPDRARAEALVHAAAEEVLQVMQRFPRAGYGWSGGKDAIVMEPIMEAAGVTRCVMSLAPELEWPEFMDWWPRHAPAGLEVDEHPRTMKWLAANPHYLFPATAKDAYRLWFVPFLQATQRRFAEKHALDVVFGGWRFADGNSIHNKPPKNRFMKYSPIVRWSHEDVFNVIAAYGKELPATYFYPRGFRTGSGPWVRRRRLATLAETWREIEAIDPSLVELARSHGLPMTGVSA